MVSKNYTYNFEANENLVQCINHTHHNLITAYIAVTLLIFNRQQDRDKYGEKQLTENKKYDKILEIWVKFMYWTTLPYFQSIMEM